MEKEIQLTENIRIPMGNAAYIYEWMKRDEESLAEDTFRKFREAESCQRTNPRQCYNLLRQVFENLAYDVEACHRKDDLDCPGNYLQLKQQVAKDCRDRNKRKIYTKRLIFNAINRRDTWQEENLFADQISPRVQEEFQKNFPSPSQPYLDTYKSKNTVYMVKNFYAETCRGDHPTPDSYFQERTNRDKLPVMFEFLFLLIQFLKCGETSRGLYEFDRNPVGNYYYPLPKSLYAQLDLDIYTDYEFYVKKEDDEGTIGWYILKPAESDGSADPNTRDWDTLNSIWNQEPYQTIPGSILRPQETLTFMDGTAGIVQVYRLPGMPCAFSRDRLAQETFLKRCKMAESLVNGVAALHEANPSRPHRTLSPHELILCGQQNFLVPVIIGFRSVKDITGQKGTVKREVRQQQSGAYREYLAPELWKEDYKGDLKKADSYSMGKLLQDIFYKELEDPCSDDYEKLKLLTDSMLRKGADDRPGIREIQNKLAAMVLPSPYGKYQPQKLIEYVWPELKVERRLGVGRGNFGEVYECRCLDIPRLNNKRAVKVMFALDGNTVDEIIHMVQQRSPHTVAIHGYKEKDTPEGKAFLICMDFLNPMLGDSGEWPEMSRQEAERKARKVGEDIGQALRVCHANHVIHRDVKPDNILMDKNEEYYLADFGLARVLDQSHQMSAWGTDGYRAPEVCTGKYDHRADIYSLGIVLYQITNEGMFPVWDPVTGWEKPKNCSQQLAEVILKMCAHKPEDRYASMDEVLNALETEPPSAIPLSSWKIEKNDAKASPTSKDILQRGLLSEKKRQVNPTGSASLTLDLLRSMLEGSEEPGDSWAHKLWERQGMNPEEISEETCRPILEEPYSDDMDFLQALLPDSMYRYLNQVLSVEQDEKKKEIRAVMIGEYNSEWRDQFRDKFRNGSNRDLLIRCRTMLENADSQVFHFDLILLFQILGDDGRRLQRCYYQCGASQTLYVALALISVYALLGTKGARFFLESPTRAGEWFFPVP